jgi:hypothetical protein
LSPIVFTADFCSADILVAESTGGNRRVIAGLSAADNGGFSNYDGEIIQWQATASDIMT